MDASPMNIEILKLFSEIIAQTINDIDNFQIPQLDINNNEFQLSIGKDILIIHSIGSKSECSMKDIIVATGLPNSTATRRVRFLLENGLVMKKTSKNDRRKTIIKLTKSGRKAFSLFFDYITHKFEKMFQMINDKEKEILIKTFKNLLDF